MCMFSIKFYAILHVHWLNIDSDNSSNPEISNKRKAMYGEIIKNPEAQVKLSIADQANFLTKVGVAHYKI